MSIRNLSNLPADSQGSVLNRVTFALREDTVLLDDNRHQNIPKQSESYKLLLQMPIKSHIPNFVGVKLPIVPAQGHTRTSGPLGHRRGCSAALHQQVGPVVGEGGHWSFSHLCAHVDPLCVSRGHGEHTIRFTLPGLDIFLISNCAESSCIFVFTTM